LREILNTVSIQNKQPATVAIGGLNAENACRVRFQSAPFATGVQLDGIAVVSALMAAPNPRDAAQYLKTIFLDAPPFFSKQSWKPGKSLDMVDVKRNVLRIIQSVQRETPLVHHLTNNVHPFILNV
jgi:thiamine-phosphate diphosphorylase/hydroxyethylthiazole kinase